MNRNLELKNDPNDVVKFADLANCLNPTPTVLYEVFGLLRTIKSSDNLDYPLVEYNYNGGLQKIIGRFVNKDFYHNATPQVKCTIIKDILERMVEKDIINPITISLN